VRRSVVHSASSKTITGLSVRQGGALLSRRRGGNADDIITKELLLAVPRHANGACDGKKLAGYDCLGLIIGLNGLLMADLFEDDEDHCALVLAAIQELCHHSAANAHYVEEHAIVSVIRTHAESEQVVGLGVQIIASLTRFGNLLMDHTTMDFLDCMERRFSGSIEVRNAVELAYHFGATDRVVS
jgi:hypothetical protein